MLTKVVSDLNSYGIIPIIKDDGSTYKNNLPQYFRHTHRGKEGFYITWDEILKDCKDSEAELYLFMPDDFLDIDFNKIKQIHETFNTPYAYNIINDGRSGMWTGIMEAKTDKGIMCGMVDCGFFCNKLALDSIGYFMEKEYDLTSSGVGKSLSRRFLKARVPMYKPVKSLAYHGDHESKMHKEERVINPLISL